MTNFLNNHYLNPLGNWYVGFLWGTK